MRMEVFQSRYVSKKGGVTNQNVCIAKLTLLKVTPNSMNTSLAVIDFHIIALVASIKTTAMALGYIQYNMVRPA